MALVVMEEPSLNPEPDFTGKGPESCSECAKPDGRITRAMGLGLWDCSECGASWTEPAVIEYRDVDGKPQAHRKADGWSWGVVLIPKKDSNA
jgi:hypothetical protein